MNRSGTPTSVPAAPASPPQALEDTQLDDVAAGAVKQQARQITIIQELGPAGPLLTSDGSAPAGRAP